MSRRRLSLLVVLPLAVAACTRVPGRQGFIIDPVLAGGVRPGIDNKASVQGTLGRPTFTGQFGDDDWYYVSRGTQQYAYKRPAPSDQTVIHVRFDKQGNVASVERTGLEKVANIRPEGDTTPTLGRNRSLFQELFGNIGQVGRAGDRQSRRRRQRPLTRLSARRRCSPAPPA